MSDSGPGRREVAYRLFAAEFDDAEFSYSESDEERAPNYVVTPTGARVNRLFAVGVLTEVDDVNPEMVRGRLVDPTGAFVTYAGQYQPDELAFLERAETPSFIALSGKARTFEPDDGDQIFTSVRPESVSEIDADTRDRWVLTAAERTIDRVGIMASAIEADLAGDQLRAALVEAGVDDRLADGVALALEYYDTTPAYLEALHATALDAVRVVAGEKDEVGRLDVGPREGIGDASELATLDLSGAPTPETAAAAAGVDTNADTAAGTEVESEDADPTKSAESEPAETEVIEEPDSGTADAEPEAVDAEPEVTETGGEGREESEAETVETEAQVSGSDSESVSDPVEEETPDSGDTTEPDIDPDDVEAVEEEMEDFDPGEFDLDEEERREVEEEYGTEFSTADEVEPADIEPEGESESGTVTEPNEKAETTGTESEVSDTDTETDAEAESETTDSTAAEPDSPDVDSGEAEPESEAEESEAEESEAEELASDADAPTEDIDLSDAVMAAMKELADGDGADQAELVATVADEQGVAEDEVEAAIQDALMSGQCYEPSDGVLKPI